MSENKIIEDQTRSECSELADKTDYPWRANFYTNARCSCCKSANAEQYFSGCAKGLEIQYPLYSNVHHCEGYEFKPTNYKLEIPAGYIMHFMGLMKMRPECLECCNNFESICDGMKWYPFEVKDGKCEFFRSKKSICKYAVSYFQYPNEMRNNYCMKPPAQRDKEYQNGNWTCNCSVGHEKYAESLKCYETRGEDQHPKGFCLQCGTGFRIQPWVPGTLVCKRCYDEMIEKQNEEEDEEEDED
jgi:hypothetical protein